MLDQATKAWPESIRNGLRHQEYCSLQSNPTDRYPHLANNRCASVYKVPASFFGGCPREQIVFSVITPYSVPIQVTYGEFNSSVMYEKTTGAMYYLLPLPVIAKPTTSRLVSPRIATQILDTVNIRNSDICKPLTSLRHHGR